MMSTYNGEKYLQEQVESIYRQKDVTVHLFVRDDGSQDGTLSELDKLATIYPRIKVIRGKNVGYARSFLSLLCNAPNTFEYYAFSDQDDVWKSSKLSDAVKNIRDQEKPCLYSCNLELVDERLNSMGQMEAPNEEDFQKGRYLIDRYSYGCTMVFNNKLKQLAEQHLPTINISHDNWLGLLAVYCGHFIFENKANILYRQHRQNVTGGKSGFIYSWRRRIKNINRIKDESKCAAAQELLKNFQEQFDDETLDLLTMVATYKKSFKNKARFFFDKRTFRKSTEKNIFFRIMILLSIA